jgi:hypothetical protein
MKRLALLAVITILAPALSGCVVVTWDGPARREHSVYVSARSTEAIRVLRLPALEPDLRERGASPGETGPHWPADEVR